MCRKVFHGGNALFDESTTIPKPLVAQNLEWEKNKRGENKTTDKFKGSKPTVGVQADSHKG